MLKTSIRALAALALLPAALCAQQPRAERAAATITAQDYARRIGVIAHDSMQGRDTPSEGLEKTAAWLGSEFSRMGLRGGLPDASFLQRYPIEQVVVDAAASGIAADGVRLAYGRDVLPLRGGAVEGQVSGGVTVVSGTIDPAALPADKLRGRHAVVVQGPNAEGGRGYFRTLGALRAAGAVSVIVATGADDAAWASEAGRALRPSVRRGWGAARTFGGDVPTVQVRTSALGRLLAGHGVDLAAAQARASGAMQVQAVPRLTWTVTQRLRSTSVTAPNVVAILDGSDPTLRDEYVVFSGHMDHVGIGTPDQNGDSIFNGADDDASGTIAVVEVARAMTALPTPPKRSVIFLLVSGEEKGLWGSDYFTQNPVVPIDHIVADLNTDMVGRNWPDTIVAIGKEHSDLGATLNRVNAAHPELDMTAIDDIWPEESFYTRSDHFNFARKGVPILFFFNGTHEDYHGRDDEVDKINSEKASRIAKLVFYLGLEVADAADRPKWDPESYRQIVGR